MPHVSARYVDQPLARGRAPWPRHRSRSDRCRRVVRSCSPLARSVKRAVVHVPDGQRQRRELLQVVVARAPSCRRRRPLRAARRAPAGLQVVEHRALGVRRAADADVGEQRRLPVAVRGLLRAVAPAEPRAVTGPGRRQRAVAHQAAEHDLPLEVGQVVRHRLRAPGRRPTSSRLRASRPACGSWWFGVQPNCARPLPPGFATVNCRNCVGARRCRTS